jgi:NAD(P)-dependent dehydrogenase (short-subunit alcohol dehydrogenase family)
VETHFKFQEARMDVEREVNRRAVIVTGASSGIGAAIAGLIGANGFPVAVNFRTNEAAAAQVVREIESAGGRAVAIRGDISREEEILQLFETAERELGKIGGLVNNAAVTGGFTRVESLSTEAIAQVLAVNVAGTMLCSREAVRRMSLRNGGLGGSIVNISSVSARTGGAEDWVHYAASKGAINTFTIGLAREVAAEGIRVNVVAPGLIDTPLHAASGRPDRMNCVAPLIPMKRFGTPREVAEGVVWLLSSAASYTTGAILEIGGGR